MHHTFADVHVQGYLGKDPKIEDNLMRVSVGYTVPRKDKDDLSKWVDLTMFSSAPGFSWLKDNLKTGDLISARGNIENGSYEKDGEKVYSTNIIVNTISIVPRETKSS